MLATSITFSVQNFYHLLENFISTHLAWRHPSLHQSWEKVAFEQVRSFRVYVDYNFAITSIYFSITATVGSNRYFISKRYLTPNKSGIGTW